MKTVTNPNPESTWSEARLQAEAFQWHYATYPDERGLLFTVDNNATDRVKGGIRKAMGRIPGVSDMLYLFNGKLFCFEFKLPGQKQSSDQRNWQYAVERHGADYSVIMGLKQFQCEINNIHEHSTAVPF